MWTDASIEAVFFDAGNTLLRVHPSVGAVYAEKAAGFGVHVEAEVLDGSFRAAWRARAALPGTTPAVTNEAAERAWWRAIVVDTFTRAGAFEAFGDRFDAFFGGLFAHFAGPEPWAVYEDVFPALETLQARGVAMAIVSNWDSRLPSLVERLGLAPYMRFALTSAQAGTPKPHRGIFEEALRRMGRPADVVAHVGDEPLADGQGAADAGLWPILVDRRGKLSHPAGAPVITTLRDLPGMLVPRETSPGRS